MQRWWPCPSFCIAITRGKILWCISDSPRHTNGSGWKKTEGTVGITDYAKKQLGDIAFVELPEVGRKVEKGAEIAVVESVKAASEVYAPAAGEVLAVNDALIQTPILINEDPLGVGWIVRLRLADPVATKNLINFAVYEIYVAGLA